jgi:replicative DNA helicase
MDRIPPQNLEAERAVLGALLLDPNAFDKVEEILKPEDFYAEAHQVIYLAMVELEQKGSPVDIITLVDHLKSQAALEKAGGPAAVASLADNIASAANIEYWARKVKDKAMLRKIISTSINIAEEAYGEPEDIEGFVSASEQMFMDIASRGVEQTYVALPELLKSGIKMLEELAQRKQMISGVPSGYNDLDNLTNGFQPQELIIVAGRPSMGKSALALNVAQNAAQDYGKSVAFFSLEMSREQLLMRLIASEARIEQNNLRRGFIPARDWEKVIKAAGKLSKAKIFIDDTSNLSVLEIKSRARRIKAEYGGLDMVIIDYLQLVGPSFLGKKRKDSREQEVSEISRSLKAMAKELNIPVIALSQLNRMVEHRDDKRPKLADLRESGAIEQDADVIAFVHRPGMYNVGQGNGKSGGKSGEGEGYNAYVTNEEGPDRNIADDGFSEIIIGKQRNGPTGMVKMQFFKNFARFEALENRYSNDQAPEMP